MARSSATVHSVLVPASQEAANGGLCLQRRVSACLCSPFFGVQGLAPETRGMERGRRLTAPSPAERPKGRLCWRFRAEGGKAFRSKRRSFFNNSRQQLRSHARGATKPAQRKRLQAEGTTPPACDHMTRPGDGACQQMLEARRAGRITRLRNGQHARNHPRGLQRATANVTVA